MPNKLPEGTTGFAPNSDVAGLVSAGSSFLGGEVGLVGSGFWPNALAVSLTPPNDPPVAGLNKPLDSP